MDDDIAPNRSPRGARLRGEPALIAGLAFLAALRVLVAAAAFPFFANVDEHRHVDMVLKYARGYLPRPGGDAYEPRTAALLAVHGSPEYGLAADGPPPAAPVWRAPPGEMARRLRLNERLLSRGPNLEATQPPVYYAVAGAWLALGSGLGLESGHALYWIRALNALSLAALVGLAWGLLRRSHADDALVRLGVPALLVVFPMDAFYYVTGDAFSPIVAGAAFALAAGCGLGGGRGPRAHAAAGLAAACAVLTKLTNLGVAAASALGAWFGGAGDERRVRRRRAAFALAFALPVAVWLLRNALVFGSLTAGEVKVGFLGWEARPLAAWLDHPLFTFGGMGTFLSELVPLFWRGELVWHRDVLASPAADHFYTLSSATCLLLAAAGLRGERPAAARRVEVLAFAAVAFSVALLALLSLSFTFPAVGNPSAAKPYFFHGRLVSGALLPFAVLYVRGLGVAVSALPPRLAPAAGGALLVATAAVCLVSEIELTLPVFSSAYNFYHLP